MIILKRNLINLVTRTQSNIEKTISVLFFSLALHIHVQCRVCVYIINARVLDN